MDDQAERPVFAYDQVAYPSPILDDVTPERLRASAMLHGFQVVDPRTASLLEIGCGDGINVLAFAAIAPQAKAVGFDLSQDAIDKGRALLARTGLGNVDLHVGDILSYPRAGEKFDYITCHGVFSWVPKIVRDAILELIAARLKPGGIAYLSYDCLPAAAAKAAINRFLRSQVRPGVGLQQALEDATRAIDLLGRNQRRGSALREQLKSLSESLPSFHPGYFYHDWLAPHYYPVELPALLQTLADKGLANAGSANNYDLDFSELDEAAQKVIEACGSDHGQRLAALGALHGSHMFQRDLIMQRAAPPLPVENALRALSYAFSGTRREEQTEQGPAVVFERNPRSSISTADGDLIAVLECLRERSPAELSYDLLSARSGVEPRVLERILLRLCACNLISAHSTPQPFTLKPGERPRAGLLLRTMLTTSAYAAGLRGTKVEASAPETRYCLSLCDGTRTRSEIATAMSRRFATAIPEALVASAIAQFANQRVFEA
ncbi:MAG TPA: class I SAM-dependent methyltransferase [Polyangiaceae bacterium]